MVCVSPLTVLVMETEKQDLHTNALLPTVFDHLRAGKEPSIMVCVSPLTDRPGDGNREAGLAHKCRFIRQIAVKAGEWMICVLLHKAIKQF